MSVMYVLLAISIIVAVIFFIAFIVSVKNGQYDDSYTPSVRMLFEDELVAPTTPESIKTPSKVEEIDNKPTKKRIGKRE